MEIYRLAFRVPTAEYRIVEDFLAAYAKSAAEQIVHAGGYRRDFSGLKLTGPNAAKEIVRYAFNELIKEKAQQEAHKLPPDVCWQIYTRR